MWLPKSISHKEDKDSNYFYESDYLSLIKDNDHKPIVVKAIKRIPGLTWKNSFQSKKGPLKVPK